MGMAQVFRKVIGLSDCLERLGSLPLRVFEAGGFDEQSFPGFGCGMVYPCVPFAEEPAKSIVWPTIVDEAYDADSLRYWLAKQGSRLWVCHRRKVSKRLFGDRPHIE